MPLAPSKSVNVKTYPALYRAVKACLLDGQRAIDEARLRTYWETGRYIQLHVLQNGNRAEYGARAIENLAEDFDIAPTVLRESRIFAERYPVLPIHRGRDELKWAHYRKLMTIQDGRERARMEEAARRNGWTSDELALQIKALARRAPAGGPSAEDAEVASLSSSGAGVPGPSSLFLVPLRGVLFTFRIFRRRVLTQGTAGLVLDLGFAVYRDVEPLGGFSEGDIVESRAKSEGYRLIKGGRTHKDLYTYNALVEKVIDGDTLKVHIDLGFGEWTRQTLRLRGVDCPEAGTRAGEAARVFVQSYLKEADQVVIRSSRDDRYGRYLADIFIPRDEGEDIYLNNLLLEQGHAQRWES